MVEEGEEIHPVLSVAVSESDEVVFKLGVSAGSLADGKSLGDLQLETETGMYVLAVNRGGRWAYPPPGTHTPRGGGSLLVTRGPPGLGPPAELLGQGLGGSEGQTLE